METNSNKNLIIGIVIAIIVIAGGYFIFGNNKSVNQTASNEPIKIGLSAPLTGEAASYGENLLGGAELAVKEINDGGVLMEDKLN